MPNKFRFDVTGLDTRDLNAVVLEFMTHALGQALHEELGAGVHSEARKTLIYEENNNETLM